MPDLTAPIVYREPIDVASGVVRITQENPGLFAGPGTNTHLLGEEQVLILDPGEVRDDAHLEAIVAAVAGRPVLAVLPSHGHPDHWPLARPLADHLDAPVWYQRDDERIGVDHVLHDEDEIELDGERLRVLHTPGHARDHLALYWSSRRLLFPGDHVMGWSTSIIAPPDGNLPQYLESLERLLAIDALEAALPAHGEALSQPYARMRELLEHRHERTRQALDALRVGPATIAELVRRIYTDVDPQLHPAAERSLWAHLLALEESGEIERELAGEHDDLLRDDAAVSFEAIRDLRWALAERD